MRQTSEPAPQDLHRQIVKFARHVQSLPSGRWVITVEKVTTTDLIWALEPPAQDLTSGSPGAYNLDSRISSPQDAG